MEVLLPQITQIESTYHKLEILRPLIVVKDRDQFSEVRVTQDRINHKWKTRILESTNQK